MVIFSVENYYRYGDTMYLDFKYGNPEKYITEKFYFSFIIGIVLSIPNLINHLVMHSRTKQCLDQYLYAFLIDSILHIVYGCLINTFLYLGGKTSMIIAYVFAGLYGFGLFINLIRICSEYTQYL